MIMFQTALSLLLQHKPNNVSKEVILTALTQHPRRILKQPAVAIQQGAPAELCLYNEKQSWEFTPQTNRSKSANSPVLNQTLRTKVVATINKNKIYTY